LAKAKHKLPASNLGVMSTIFVYKIIILHNTVSQQ